MINAKQIWPGAWQLLFLFYWPNKLLFQSGETIWTFVWGSGYRKGRPFGWSPVIPPLVPTCFPMCINPPQQKGETTASRRHPACKRLGSAVIQDWAAPPWSNETPEAKPPPQGLNACILPDARRALTSTRRRKGHGTRRGLNARPVNTLRKTTARVCGMRFVGHTWRKLKQRAEPPRRRAHHAQEWLKREGLRRGAPKRQFPTLVLALTMLG